MSFGKVVLGFFVLILLPVGLYYWQDGRARREASDSIGPPGWEESSQKKSPSAPIKAYAGSSWIGKPKGKSITAIGTDASASMTPATLAKQASMLDSVASHVSGDNFLSLYTMGSKVYRHNTGSSSSGRATVLSNWRSFLPYKQDSLFTNCTAALQSMVSDVIPLVQQGYVAEVILITDGKHEPPPDQNDEDIKWEIQTALIGIPIEYRNRLRIHIVEVGSLLQYSGQVAALLPAGFAATLRADSWDDVWPIILDLQKRIEGRFGWVNAPANAYHIGAPSENAPKVLGPFTFDLSGPDQVEVQVDLATNDLVDSNEQLILEASIDNGEWIKLARDQLTLKDASAVRFRFYENSRNQLPSNWFDVWQRDYSLKLLPVDNLIPLVSEGEAVKVQVEKPAFIWALGAVLALLALAVFLFCLWLIGRWVRIVRDHYETASPPALPVKPVLTIVFAGIPHALNTGEILNIGQVTFTASADGLEVTAEPEVPVRLEYVDLAYMQKVRQQFVPSEIITLNPENQARIVNLVDREEYHINPVQNQEITPIMLLTTGG